MNGIIAGVLSSGLLLGMAAIAADAPELKDQKAKVSYGIGMNLGAQFKSKDVEIDPQILLRGLEDALAGDKTLMTEAEMRTVLVDYQRENQARQMEKRKQLGDKNKAEGEKFLAENKTKPGVVTLPSGLQYKVVTEGSGDSPKTNDLVTVNYRGRLLDGTEFDSSYKRGEPATMSLARVIKGWQEAVALMKPGAKWELFIPAALAYGENGSGKQIGPNAALQFEIELVSFKSPPPPPMPPTKPAEPVTSDIIKVPSKAEMDKGAKIEVLKKEDVERLTKEQQEKAAGGKQ